jgi:hypothetical protein
MDFSLFIHNAHLDRGPPEIDPGNEARGKRRNSCGSTLFLLSIIDLRHGNGITRTCGIGNQERRRAAAANARARRVFVLILLQVETKKKDK